MITGVSDDTTLFRCQCGVLFRINILKQRPAFPGECRGSNDRAQRPVRRCGIISRWVLQPLAGRRCKKCRSGEGPNPRHARRPSLRGNNSALTFQIRHQRLGCGALLYSKIWKVPSMHQAFENHTQPECFKSEKK